MSGSITIELTPLGVRLTAPRGTLLQDLLAAHGVEFPCGGEGTCGCCCVRVIEGALPVTPGDEYALSADEIVAGWRLACRARATGALRLEVGQWATSVLTDFTPMRGAGESGLGIDLGTTTIAAQLLDLATAEVLAVRTGLNPQAACGADVMSRVRFALSDNRLTTMIREFLGATVAELAAGRASQVTRVVLVGNTVMHHLFAGLTVEPLSHVPFEPADARERQFTPAELGWPLADGCRVRFLRCLGGFVGSDILAGILATGMPQADRLTALIDLGTNGEIALGDRDGIVCASTAAGPALEAACIRAGMRATDGAIWQVALRDGAFECNVIGGCEPRGICSSGLIDAVSAGLEAGVILSSGRLANGAREFPLAPPVVLTQDDIRELQLAKAAIASGLRILLHHRGAAIDDIESGLARGRFRQLHARGECGAPRFAGSPRGTRDGCGEHCPARGEAGSSFGRRRHQRASPPRRPRLRPGVSGYFRRLPGVRGFDQSALAFRGSVTYCGDAGGSVRCGGSPVWRPARRRGYRCSARQCLTPAPLECETLRGRPCVQARLCPTVAEFKTRVFSLTRAFALSLAGHRARSFRITQSRIRRSRPSTWRLHCKTLLSLSHLGYILSKRVHNVNACR